MSTDYSANLPSEVYILQILFLFASASVIAYAGPYRYVFLLQLGCLKSLEKLKVHFSYSYKNATVWYLYLPCDIPIRNSRAEASDCSSWFNCNNLLHARHTNNSCHINIPSRRSVLSLISHQPHQPLQRVYPESRFTKCIVICKSEWRSDVATTRIGGLIHFTHVLGL